MKDFYNNNDAPPPTSALQNDPGEDLYSSSRSPRRQAQPQPSLQPTAVDDEEEDLYGASPPRNRNLPPAAQAPASTLHLPGAPPPTPHDPYIVNGSPFLFPTMYDQPPPPPITKQSSSLTSGKTTNGLGLPPLRPPTSRRNPGFRVPSPSSSPEANSKTPSNPVPAAKNVKAPAQRRPVVNPNPHGTYEVPDTGSDSSENPDSSANAAGEQNSTVYPTAARPTTATQTADPPRGAAQTNGPHPHIPTATAQPVEPDIDAQAWATVNAGWFNKPS